MTPDRMVDRVLFMTPDAEVVDARFEESGTVRRMRLMAGETFRGNDVRDG
jgi:hypothetical protein